MSQEEKGGYIFNGSLVASRSTDGCQHTLKIIEQVLIHTGRGIHGSRRKIQRQV